MQHKTLTKQGRLFLGAVDLSLFRTKIKRERSTAPSTMIKISLQLSGKLYLLNEHNKLNELISWRACFNSNLVTLPSIKQNNDERENGITVTRHLLCIDLISEQELFGAIHFLGCKNTL